MMPQSRGRLFLMGVKSGETVPAYPSPITPRADDAAPSGTPTCADALSDLPDAETFNSLIHCDQVRTIRRGMPSA
jgi:DNA (cytosine-5)-methyltransferase 1